MRLESPILYSDEVEKGPWADRDDVAQIVFGFDGVQHLKTHDDKITRKNVNVKYNTADSHQES